MIDITKKHRTEHGYRVTNLSYVPYNSVGEKVTFPIKGTIVLSEKPYKATYEIWTEDGLVDVLGKRTHRNLVEVNE